MAEFGVAVNVITVIDTSIKVGKLCHTYYKEVKGAREEIAVLKDEAEQNQHVLESVKDVLDGPDGSALKASQKLKLALAGCQKELQEVVDTLDRDSARKAMSKFGLRALKWPFKSGEVKKIITKLSGHRETLSLALSADTIGLLFDMNRKMDFVQRDVKEIGHKIDFGQLQIAQGAAYNSRAQEHASRCLAATRQDLLKDIIAWAEGTHDRCIFWLNGMAGTGKSTIARTVSEELAKRKQLGASFFFKKGEADRGSAMKFLTTLAADLARALPAVQPGMQSAIRENPTLNDRALNVQFDKLILGPLKVVNKSSPPLKKLVIVVDALDECESWNDIRAIIYLCTQARGLQPISLRFFITSRPELPIRLQFSEVTTDTYQTRCLDHVHPDTIMHDIEAFLNHEFATIRKQRQLPSDWPSEVQLQRLVSLASPSFIFAATACRFVANVRDDPKKKLERYLAYQRADQARKLDSVYLPVLDQLLDGEDEEEDERRIQEFREVVGTIILLETPLSVVSLSLLLELSREDLFARLELLHSVLFVPPEVDTPIRTLHLSFQDFLLSSGKRGPGKFSINQKDQHRVLYKRCLAILATPGCLKENICDLPFSGSFRTELGPNVVSDRLLAHEQYACRYWIHHLVQSGELATDNDQVHEFLQAHMFHWLEALSLMGMLSEGISMVMDLQTKVKTTTKLWDLVHELHRFVLAYWIPIDQAPLQAYALAQVFTPNNSLLRDLLSEKTPEWLLVTPKVPLEWSSALLTLAGHTSFVDEVNYSPRGDTLATRSEYEMTVRLWDARTGAQLQVQQYNSPVLRAAFCYDGNRVACLCKDGHIQMWDSVTGATLSDSHISDTGLTCGAFSPDQICKLVATVGGLRTTDSGAMLTAPNVVRLWDTLSGAKVLELDTQSDVEFLTFSPSCKLLASISRNGPVRLWDVETGALLHQFENHYAYEFSQPVAFSPDGMKIAAPTTPLGTQSLVRDVVTGAHVIELQVQQSKVADIRDVLLVISLAFSPNGTRLASASTTGQVYLWDALTGELLRSFRGHAGWYTSVAFSPDGNQLASTGLDRTVKIWDTVAHKTQLANEYEGADYKGVKVLADGVHWASITYGGIVSVSELTNAKPPFRSDLRGDRPNFTSYLLDGRHLIYASEDTQFIAWDLIKKKQTHKFHAAQWNKRAFTSHDGKLLGVAYGVDCPVRAQIWDLVTGNSLWALETGSMLTNGAFSTDNSQFAVCTDENAIQIIEVKTGKRLHTVSTPNPIGSLAYSWDSGQLATLTYDDGLMRQNVQVWDIAAGVLLHSVYHERRYIHQIRAVMGHSKCWALSFEDGAEERWGSHEEQCDSEAEPLEVSSLTKPQVSPKSPCFTQCTQWKPGCALTIENHWILRNGQRLLWLPPDYRSPRVRDNRDNIFITETKFGWVAIFVFKPA